MKKNLVSHYNKDDIMKNKIANTDRLRKVNKSGRFPSLQAQKKAPKEEYADDFVEDKPDPKEGDFFATQPTKKNRSVTYNGINNK